jgi:hypothetical protein
MNWKNLGGALAVTGTSLIGVGVLAQLSQIPNSTKTFLTDNELAVMWWIAAGGFVMSCIGKGLTAYFAADKGSVTKVARAVDKINQSGDSPDTQLLVKPKPTDSAQPK